MGLREKRASGCGGIMFTWKKPREASSEPPGRFWGRGSFLRISEGKVDRIVGEGGREKVEMTRSLSLGVACASSAAHLRWGRR